jgi:hypothetical protein
MRGCKLLFHLFDTGSTPHNFYGVTVYFTHVPEFGSSHERFIAWKA